MNNRKIKRHYDDAFKKEAVNLVLTLGCSVQQAASSLGIAKSLLYKWKEQHTNLPLLNSDEKIELMRLRKENKQLKMEQEILKKGQCLLCEARKVRYLFIKKWQLSYPVRLLCKVMVQVWFFYILFYYSITLNNAINDDN